MWVCDRPRDAHSDFSALTDGCLFVHRLQNETQTTLPAMPTFVITRTSSYFVFLRRERALLYNIFWPLSRARADGMKKNIKYKKKNHAISVIVLESFMSENLRRLLNYTTPRLNVFYYYCTHTQNIKFTAHASAVLTTDPPYFVIVWWLFSRHARGDQTTHCGTRLDLDDYLGDLFSL